VRIQKLNGVAKDRAAPAGRNVASAPIMYIRLIAQTGTLSLAPAGTLYILPRWPN
jgi:hypothetical protein